MAALESDVLNEVDSVEQFRLYTVRRVSQRDPDPVPWLCVPVAGEPRFVPVPDLADCDSDSPQHLDDAVLGRLTAQAVSLHPSQILGFWSARERVFSEAQVLAEVEAILASALDVVDDQAALRALPEWPGTEIDLHRGPNGEFRFASLRITTANPFMLRSLLIWLGAPADVISKLTGL